MAGAASDGGWKRIQQREQRTKAELRAMQTGNFWIVDMHEELTREQGGQEGLGCGCMFIPAKVLA